MIRSSFHEGPAVDAPTTAPVLGCITGHVLQASVAERDVRSRLGWESIMVEAAAQIARAQDYVLQGRAFVVAQRAFIEDRRLSGRATDFQEDLLYTFEKTLAAFEEHLARVRAKV